MPKYKIFAGLGGGFGGATQQFVDEYSSPDEAEMVAYETAIEEYESYGGMHGLMSWEEAMDEAESYCERLDDETDEEYFDSLEIYAQEARESWLDY